MAFWPILGIGSLVGIFFFCLELRMGVDVRGFVDACLTDGAFVEAVSFVLDGRCERKAVWNSQERISSPAMNVNECV